MGESGILGEQEWARIKQFIHPKQENSLERFKQPLDSYMSTLSFGNSCIERIGRHCVRFFKYLKYSGVLHVGCVTLEDISSFFEYDTHASEQIAKECRRDIIRCIEHMGESGMLDDSEWARIKSFIRPPLPVNKDSLGCFRELMDSYLATLSFGDSCIKRIRCHCTRFFKYLNNCGIIQVGLVTLEDVSSFFGQDTHASEHIAKECRRDINRCIEYMGEHEMLSEPEWARISLFIHPPLPPLEGSELEKFSKLAKDNAGEPLSLFDERCAVLLNYMENSHYAKTPINDANRIVNSLRNFMSTNNLPYSHALALEWLEFFKAERSYGQYTADRRIVMLIHDMSGADGTPELKTMYVRKCPEAPPEWGKSLISSYMEVKRREGCAKPTLSMVSRSCIRLIRYMDANNIRWDSLSALALKDFYVSSKHRTPQGRNALGAKIRGFLRYLADKGVVPITLQLAIPRTSAPRVRIIKTLTGAQSDALYAYRASAATPMELRASAAIMLALTMGFRSSDIAKLKFSELSFDLEKITLTQQKSERLIEQPLTVEAGNSLWRYIHEGRPEHADSAYIFVRSEAPYGKLSAKTIAKEINFALSAMDTEDSTFHTLRKTFASRLLSSGSNTSIVSVGLGHADTETVEKYLSTDEKGMRECPIGLDGIEYTGGFGL
jgi:site-specific recombinase XerD